LGDFIGSGASGSVHIATYKPNNIQIAVKSINLYDKGTRKQFKNDLRLLVDNECPNLIRFYGAFFYEGNVKILLEYMNIGSLDRVIEMLKKKKKSTLYSRINFIIYHISNITRIIIFT
jgi:serine/threonine protein kinase